MASLGSTARSLILLQLLSRVLTFSLNQLLVRIASPSVFGTAAVQFDLVLSTLLFLSREGVRLTVLRAPKGDASISEAQVTSLSLLPLPVSLGLSVVLVPLYLRSMPSTTTSQPSFHLALGTYILAAVLELSIEPLYNMAQRAGRVNLRVKAEGAAVIARAIATVTLVGFGGEQWALRGFAIGQLSYALCLMAIFGWEFRSSLAQIYVQRNENDATTTFNAKLVKQAAFQSLQSVLKHILTEADRIIISLACALNEQGGWAVVVGYGSLITRIVFQPMEETTLLYFSRILADAKPIVQDGQPVTQRKVFLEASTHLCMLLQFSTHLLVLLPAFLPSLLPSILPFLLPRQYLSPSSSTPSTLVTYLSIYIPVLSLNGILEAFHAATATPKDLANQSRAMALGTVVFAATLFGLTQPETARYLQQAGVIDTTIKTETALIYSNATQMLVRILYALRHTQRFFAPTGGITISKFSPDRRTVALVIASSAVLHSSKKQYITANADLKSTALFVGLGGVLGLVCLASAYIFTFRGLIGKHKGDADSTVAPPKSGLREAAKPTDESVLPLTGPAGTSLGRLRATLLARRAGVTEDDDPLNPSQDARTFAAAIKRRRRMTGLLYKHSAYLCALFILVGLGWLLLLPADVLRKRSYVDEHAMSPGGVTTYYDWSDVHQADIYLGELEDLWAANASAEERSQHLMNTFINAGVPAGRLPYAFQTSNGATAGITTFAHVSPPRSTGTETILISANWLSLQSSPNLRGVALLLSLAKFLRSQNHWAFDFALVVGDGYLDGIQAFLASYHGVDQSNLQVAPLDPPIAGNIWTALNVDYPGHSFSHLGLFYEGVNGRLPNQDILNAVTYVSRWTGGVPIRLHDIEDHSHAIELPEWLSPVQDRVRHYLGGLAHIKDHFGYAALGRPSGAHGVFAKYRIDAITLFASPATGPHGFHAFGRVLEASMRSMNNLLERLHASYFFYILPSPDTFLPVGQYLPAVVLIGIGITIRGLSQWVEAGWVLDTVQGWQRRKRPLLLSLALITGAFSQGLFLWYLQRSARGRPLHHDAFVRLATWSFMPVAFVLASDTFMDHALNPTISSLTHLLIGAIISALAMVNFPQACLLVALLFPVLIAPQITVVTSRVWPPLEAFKAVIVFGMSPMALVTTVSQSHPDLWRALVEEYDVLGNLALPSIYLVWWPLWQLAAFAAMTTYSDSVKAKQSRETKNGARIDA